MPRIAASRSRNGTRDALISTALRLIAQKGVEATSVLEITGSLGVSNGTFYYYFANMDQLLEEVGHAVVEGLVERIEDNDRPDVASRIVRGPLIVLKYVNDYPELRQILLRVIEDPLGVHADLHARLRNNVEIGRQSGRFAVPDLEVAVRFARGVIGMAVRLALEGADAEELRVLTAVHTLGLLGVESQDAREVVRLEKAIIDSTSY